VTIAGTGTFALQEQTGGTASFTNVTATGVAQASAGNPPSYNCEGGNFAITDGGGNSGITPTQCITSSPTPVYPPYPVTGVNASPTALSFGSAATGTTTAAQTVTVANPTSSAASVSSIATSGDFSQASTCGSSIGEPGRVARPRLDRDRPAAVGRVVDQDPDAVRPRLGQRQQLLHAGGLRRTTAPRIPSPRPSRTNRFSRPRGAPWGRCG
jgi:hypothetical protein